MPVAACVYASSDFPKVKLRHMRCTLRWFISVRMQIQISACRRSRGTDDENRVRARGDFWKIWLPENLIKLARWRECQLRYRHRRGSMPRTWFLLHNIFTMLHIEDLGRRTGTFGSMTNTDSLDDFFPYSGGS